MIRTLIPIIETISNGVISHVVMELGEEQWPSQYIQYHNGHKELYNLKYLNFEDAGVLAEITKLATTCSLETIPEHSQKLRCLYEHIKGGYMYKIPILTILIDYNEHTINLVYNRRIKELQASEITF